MNKEARRDYLIEYVKNHSTVKSQIKLVDSTVQPPTPKAPDVSSVSTKEIPTVQTPGPQ